MKERSDFIMNLKLFLLAIILFASLGFISASGITINPSSIIQGTSANITVSMSKYNSYVYFYPQGSLIPLGVNLDLGCGNNCAPNTYPYTFPSTSFTPGTYTLSIFSLDPSNTGWINSTFTVVSNVCTQSVPSTPDGNPNYYVGELFKVLMVRQQIAVSLMEKLWISIIALV